MSEIKYRIECYTCRKQFIVGDALSPVPEHVAKGINEITNAPNLLCGGSGLLGKPIGPELK